MSKYEQDINKVIRLLQDLIEDILAMVFFFGKNIDEWYIIKWGTPFNLIGIYNVL